MAKYTVGTAKRPIILVDWSDLDEYKGHFLLRASLASHGRGLCVYEEVHGIKTKEKPQTHIQFLSNLARVLDKDGKPIIVSDAGYKTPWFRATLDRGWDFVGRIRHPNFYSLDDENWECITQFYSQATNCPKSYSGLITRSNPLKCRLVIYKQKKKGRKDLKHSGKPRKLMFSCLPFLEPSLQSVSLRTAFISNSWEMLSNSPFISNSRTQS